MQNTSAEVERQDKCWRLRTFLQFYTKKRTKIYWTVKLENIIDSSVHFGSELLLVRSESITWPGGRAWIFTAVMKLAAALSGEQVGEDRCTLCDHIKTSFFWCFTTQMGIKTYSLKPVMDFSSKTVPECSILPQWATFTFMSGGQTAERPAGWITADMNASAECQRLDCVHSVACVHGLSVSGGKETLQLLSPKSSLRLLSSIPLPHAASSPFSSSSLHLYSSLGLCNSTLSIILSNNHR